MSMPPALPKKILVYGVYGSGKTTLAVELGRRLGLPFHSTDDLTWEPGWKEVPVKVQRDRIAKICRQKSWVLDAAYSAWEDLPLASADLIVGLDYPRWLSLRRLWRRTWDRVATGETICNGNRETVGSVLSFDSILVWHFAAFKSKQRRMRRWHADPSAPPVLLFTDPAEVDAWLATLPAARR